MTDVVLTEIVMPGLIEPDGLIVRERSAPTPGDGEALACRCRDQDRWLDDPRRRRCSHGRPGARWGRSRRGRDRGPQRDHCLADAAPQGHRRSFDLLASGGTLVAYGTATQRDDSNNLVVTFAGIFARFALWSALPNGRRATFYNFWGGSKARPAVFRKRLATDLTHVLELMRDGAITPQVAARIPLREASRALALAESKTVRGKVVLVP